MKKLLLIIAVALSACRGDAISVTKNGDFKIEFLFEKDGCKMYRFYDGRTVYWSNCEGRVSSDHETHSGKNGSNIVHHYEETITTN